MAAGTLPKPGTEYGPCEDTNCGHLDCQGTRDDAAALCTECGEPIGYDARMYRVHNGLAHAACIER